MAEATPPVLKGPTSKEKKYDRQLRLWAASGQAALEDAHILLLNSGPGVVGIEALKNLVLPGVGQFTILDSALVTEADLGVNFFLEDKHIGGFRAEHTCNLLEELNPDVQGNFLTEPIESFLSNPQSLSAYSLIFVVAPIDSELLAIVQMHATSTSTPVFYLHSVGFYSRLSVHLPSSFPIVDTHPEPVTLSDLRILKPWPALQEYARKKTEGIKSMSDDDHGHIPYVALLLHYTEEWNKAHPDEPVQSYKTKTAFREMVKSEMRTDNPEVGEENYEEAVAAVLKAMNDPKTLGGSLMEVFGSPECVSLLTDGGRGTEDSPQPANFWVIAAAISQFHHKHGVLPLSGSVPDMKARSGDYIQLQNVYKSKAREDIQEVLRLVREWEEKHKLRIQIEEKEVEAFCKNASSVKVVRGRPFHVVRQGEKVAWGNRAKSIATTLSFPDSGLPLYIAFLAYDSFTASHKSDEHLGAPQPPGIADADADAEKMTGIAHKILDGLLNDAGQIMDDPEYSELKEEMSKIVQEMCRAGGAELHNISSLSGGLIAQEAIKVITKQYVPVDNTCVFDGIKSKSSVIKV